MHSGSANAGHYWSYINTNRGIDEEEGGDPTWLQTENDPWMEFNDSQVRDYKFENLNEDCEGDAETKGGYGGGFGGWGGGNYGKSGYMLFYERRKKKDLTIVLPCFKVNTDGQQGLPIIATVLAIVKDNREVNKMVQEIKGIFDVFARQEAEEEKKKEEGKEEAK